MPTYKFTIREVMYRYTSDVEVEAASLKDAMAQLAEDVPSPDFYWGAITRDMMVLELAIDDEPILEDTSTQLDMWPMDLVEEGRVWEGSEGGGNDAGEYLMERMPTRVQLHIDAEEEQAE